MTWRTTVENPVPIPKSERAQAWEDWLEQREDFLQHQDLTFPTNAELDWAQAAFYAGYDAALKALANLRREGGQHGTTGKPRTLRHVRMRQGVQGHFGAHQSRPHLRAGDRPCRRLLLGDHRKRQGR